MQSAATSAFAYSTGEDTITLSTVILGKLDISTSITLNLIAIVMPESSSTVVKAAVKGRGANCQSFV